MGLVRTNVSGEFEIKGATTIDVVTAKALHDCAVAFVARATGRDYLTQAVRRHRKLLRKRMEREGF